MNNFNLLPLYFFRFVAVLIIVFFHFAPKYFFNLNLKFLHIGPPMVTFFFVLSGFLLFYNYYKKEFNIKIFFIKRIKRLYPLYVISLIISSIIIFHKTEFNVISFFINLFCLESWFPPYSYDLNPPAWFVSTLSVYYLLFPLIFIYLKKNSPDKNKVFLVSILIWILTFSVLTNLLNLSSFYVRGNTISHHLIYYFPFTHFSSFFIGVAGAYYILNKEKILKTNIFFFGIIILFIILTQAEDSIENILGIKIPFGANFYSLLFLLFIFSIISSKKNILLNFFSKKFFLLLGELSYGIYILQFPMYLIYNFCLKKINIKNNTFSFLIFLIILIFVSGVLDTFLKKSFKRK